MRTHNIPSYWRKSIRNPYNAIWSGSIINNQWLELPLPRTKFYSPIGVRAIEVRLYVQPEYDSGTNNPKDLPPAFHDHTYGLQHGFNQSKTLDSTNINPFLNKHSYSRQENNTPTISKGSLNDHLYCKQPGSIASKNKTCKQKLLTEKENNLIKY